MNKKGQWFQFELCALGDLFQFELCALGDLFLSQNILHNFSSVIHESLLDRWQWGG
jgi:hypothetical protein